MKRLLPLLLAATMSSAAELPPVIRLWPGAAPGSDGITLSEKITERSQNPDRPDRIYTQINDPALAVHRPAHPNGTAVIIAPGGAYTRIVIDKEAPDTTAWLNRLGVTVFVLKYRLPDEGHMAGHQVPLQDGQRAVRVVRANAAAWGLDPKRIGFLGYSAGGHLAASVAFFADRCVYDPVDAADGLSASPDFLILGYAVAQSPYPRPQNLEAVSPRERMMWEYRIEYRPGVAYPPTFLFHADDDPVVDPRNALQIYAALKEARTPAELHLFKRGGHGFGIRDTSGPNEKWPELCAAWLREIRVLEGK